jgi:hypothetical protein
MKIEVEDYIKNVINKQNVINEANRKQNSEDELRRSKLAEQTYKELILIHSSLCEKCCGKKPCEMCESNFPKITLNCVVCGENLKLSTDNIKIKKMSLSKETLEDMRAFGLDVREYGISDEK